MGQKIVYDFIGIYDKNQFLSSFKNSFLQKSANNFCTSNSLKNELKSYNIKSVPLFDYSTNTHVEVSEIEIYEEKKKILRNYQLEDDTYLIVCPADQVFDDQLELLLKTSKRIDSQLSNSRHEILFLIIGKQRPRYFEMELIDLHLTNITFHFTDEIFSNKYRCADLVIFLENSKYDLPTHLFEVISCHLPIISLDSESIQELIQNGKNGFLFQNHDELAEILIAIVILERINPDTINYIQDDNQKFDWNIQWKEKILPFLK